ncbi:MAG TPA: PatB family C-S lyase [Anaerolineales bacterium]|nr:PatB family C-S lyase [Anaerolineales bacterium]HMS00406.1 PatB family C-S lyase [Anaerolineales bacterium]HNQ95500.1 PatB family C-S lyase [Anaerolineales bacterium]HNS61903.1 PatB family C-S lyase [Anaerolineales bacterium]
MPYNFDSTPNRRDSHSLKWTTYPKDVLPLWVADMDFETPAPIRDALRAALDHGVLGYELLKPQTQQVVAARMDRLHGWQVDPDWVVETIGVVNGFNLAARTVCVEGDGVLMQTPVYNKFYELYENVTLTRQFAPFSFMREGNILAPQLDLDVFARSFHSNEARTRMFLLCHPHNPMGNVFSREELVGMAELCLQNDVAIVSDEIHSELILDGSKHIPLAMLSKDVADKTITLISPSKTFNTAGLFCAFAIIPNADLRERYKKTAGQTTGHVSSLGVIGAETAFSGACDDWLAQLRTYLKANRDFAADYLTENFPQASYTVPAATYLHWIDFGAYVKSGQITTSPYEFFLNKAKVALSDGRTFGAEGENFVRLNFGAPRSLIAEGLERMYKALD